MPRSLHHGVGFLSTLGVAGFTLGVAGCFMGFMAGCAGSQATRASVVTPPTEPAVEPRGATGQLLEDLFFVHVAPTDRFDLDAALDEGGGGEAYYYDEVAAGEYEDETAAGEDPLANDELRLARLELEQLETQLGELERGLRGESHPLADEVAELREQLAMIREHPEDYPDAETVAADQRTTLQSLVTMVEAHVQGAAARPADATDCSVATLALYTAIYDTTVDVAADAHITLRSYLDEQSAWLEEQRGQMNAAAASIEWLDAHPAVSVNGDELDEFFGLLERLDDPDTYLTPGSGEALDEVTTGVFEAETDQQLHAALTALRDALMATLASVQDAPYVAEVQAYEALQEGLSGAWSQLPLPGPRAALRVLRRYDVARHLGALGWSESAFSGVMHWVQTACEGPPPARSAAKSSRRATRIRPAARRAVSARPRLARGAR